MTRLLIVAMCAVLITGCSFRLFSPAPTPHSKYFIVAFAEGTLEPSTEGQAALDTALVAAKGGSRVIIDGPLSGGEIDRAANALMRQRAAAMEQRLLAAGVPATAVEQRLRDVGEKEFLSRKDTVILQVIYGVDG